MQELVGDGEEGLVVSVIAQRQGGAGAAPPMSDYFPRLWRVAVKQAAAD